MVTTQVEAAGGQAAHARHDTISFTSIEEQIHVSSILVATDGSELADKAVSSAIDLAAESAAELVALTVVPRYARDYYDGVMILSDEEIARIEGQSVKAAQTRLDEVGERARARGVRSRPAQLSPTWWPKQSSRRQRSTRAT